jgi:hypothetical protein
MGRDGVVVGGQLHRLAGRAGIRHARSEEMLVGQVGGYFGSLSKSHTRSLALGHRSTNSPANEVAIRKLLIYHIIWLTGKMYSVISMFIKTP